MLDQKLSQLAARRFYPSGWADDGVGLELVVEPWMIGVVPALKTVLELDSLSVSISDDTLYPQRMLLNAEMNTITTLSVPQFVNSNDLISSPADTTNLRVSSAIVENKSLSIKLSEVVKSDPFTCMSSSITQLTTSSDSSSLIDNSVLLRNFSTNTSNMVFVNLATLQTLKDESSELHNIPLSRSSTSSLAHDIDSPFEILSVNEQEVAVNMTTYKQESVDGNDRQQEIDVVTPPIISQSLICVTPQLPLLMLTSPSLSAEKLTLPTCMPRHLSLTATEVLDKISLKVCDIIYPLAASALYHVPLLAATRLTSMDSTKNTLQFELDITSCDWTYEPGDSISVVCQNDRNEVDELISRLHLADISHLPYLITSLTNRQDKQYHLHDHLPCQSTIHDLLLKYCDIRTPAKKVFLCALAEYTCDSKQRRRLEELSSRQGSQCYRSYVLESRLSILELFKAFDSCYPPVELLLEHLPRLQPRPYSCASSPLDTPGKLTFVFNVITLNSIDGMSCRKGVCTGWLETVSSINGELITMTTQYYKKDATKIPIYLRKSSSFRLPSDPTVPIIMIGPGTGIAPFIGFLKHRSSLHTLPDRGDSWLFTGFRQKDKDELFRTEINVFLSNGTLTRAVVSFSRELDAEGTPRYVQDNLRVYSDELILLVTRRNAIIYICGDASGMAPKVRQTFMELFQLHEGRVLCSFGLEVETSTLVSLKQETKKCVR